MIRWEIGLKEKEGKMVFVGFACSRVFCNISLITSSEGRL